jgi:hypothetical protein
VEFFFVADDPPPFLGGKSMPPVVDEARAELKGRPGTRIMGKFLLGSSMSISPLLSIALHSLEQNHG